MELPRLNVLHVVLLMALVLGVIGFPLLAGGRPATYKTVCISNLKQLSTGTIIYQGDFDERLPNRDWVEATMLYTKTTSLYTCPDVARQKGRWGYAMGYALLGKDGRKIAKPAETPMYFEVDALAKDVVTNIGARSLLRHKTGSNVGRVDGSVKFVPRGTHLEDLP